MIIVAAEESDLSFEGDIGSNIKLGFALSAKLSLFRFKRTLLNSTYQLIDVNVSI